MPSQTLATVPSDLFQLVRTFTPGGAGRFAVARAAAHLPAPMRPARSRVASLRLRGDGANPEVWIRGVGSSDIEVLYEVFLRDEYGPLEACREVRTILDLGANVGLAAARLLRRHPHARLLAVEPDPENVALCRRNLAAFGERAEVLHAAVWTHPGEVALRRTGDGREWAISVAEPEPGEATIPALDVPSLLAHLGTTTLDVLKIDVEGAETDIFGDPGAAQWLPRVGVLAVEVHGDASRSAVLGALRVANATLRERGDVVFAEIPVTARAVAPCAA